MVLETQARDTHGTRDTGQVLPGYCSQCHKPWTLEADTGNCTWCGRYGTRQTNHHYQQAVRTFGRPRSRKRPVAHVDLDRLYHGQLDAVWESYHRIAVKFALRAKVEDRADLLHTLMVSLADVKRAKPDITEAGLFRVAKLEVAHYWYAQRSLTYGIDCSKCNSGRRKGCRDNDQYRECPRAVKIESLEKPIIDSEGNLTEIGDLVADDTVLDIDAWLDAQNVVRRLPLRLIDIARQIEAGKPLDHADRLYLSKWRKRLYAQKSLFD